MKRFLTVLLAAALMFAFCATAYAANNDGSITLTNAVNGEKYNAYKIFDLTFSDSNITYTYTASGASDDFLADLTSSASPFNALRVGSTDVYNITKKDNVTDDNVISWLKSNIGDVSNDNKLAEKTGANNTAKWENIAYGYYYV